MHCKHLLIKIKIRHRTSSPTLGEHWGPLEGFSTLDQWLRGPAQGVCFPRGGVEPKICLSNNPFVTLMGETLLGGPQFESWYSRDQINTGPHPTNGKKQTGEMASLLPRGFWDRSNRVNT